MDLGIERSRGRLKAKSRRADVTVRDAGHGDVPEILSLARSLSPGERSAAELSRSGFLVSDFGQADYEAFIDHTEYAYVAVHQGRVVGFLLGYRGEQAEQMHDHTAMKVADKLPAFVVCKQIAVGADHAGRGVGRALYEHLISHMGDRVVLIAATVDVPPNDRSRGMHRKIGFVPAFHIEHPDGRPRTVWRFDRG